MTDVNASLSTVVKTGTYRESLLALRDYLAAALEGVDPKDAAPLARQLSQTLTAIEALPAAEEASRLDRLAGGLVDELAPRRAVRRAGAPAS